MLKYRLGTLALVCAFIGLAAAGCDSDVKGGGSGGGGNGAGGNGGNGGSGGGSLQWYTTCGDPVCMTPDGGSMPPAGVDPCTTEMEGAACSTEGARCWPVNDCGVVLICAKSDPKDNPGGCPI
ncbi:hypothetical protein [Polyangium aurulentum]|uniref:hypothetical protein n=1 Tax=Polyangium aurulentum TaxID=2567896 RepID=UPI0010AEB2C7|nr:hypothetical protein [Polyangium aurulentum]UQA56786.1 hypothetical protein E8A73_036615 [Polyangium aurulentum]